MSISFMASGYSDLSSIASVERTSSTKTTSTENASSAMSQSIREMRTADPSGINREIKVNGKVIGFIYNSGVTAIVNEYSHLTDQLGWNSPNGLPEDEKGLYGPNLADLRAQKLLAVLREAVSGASSQAEGSFLSTLKGASFEISIASTAMTQAEFESW